MDEEQLIMLVQKYPELWDMSHPSYHNQERKDNAWEEIANQNFVGKTGDACKKKWFSLRDSFRRNIKKKKTITGQARKKIKLWRYEKQMEFLLPCFEERSQLSNYGDESESEQADNDEEEQERPTVEEFSSPVLSPAVSLPSPQGNNASSSTPSVVKKKRLIKKTNSPPVRAANVLQSYLENRAPKQPKDQLTKFFQAMELTVRSLPYPLQVETKSKIFQVVNDAELRAFSLQKEHNAISTPSETSRVTPLTTATSVSSYPVGYAQTTQMEHRPYQQPYYNPNQSHGHFEPIHYNSDMA